MEYKIDPDRIDCDDPLDNAEEIEVEEISEMCCIQLDPTTFKKWPGKVYYPASDVCLILSELMSMAADLGCEDLAKGYKKTVESVTKRISDEQENAQETKRKEDWWKH